jgi:hypothetical protein
MTTQEAIFHGAGECSSVMLVTLDGAGDRDQANKALLERAARLMALLEQKDAGGPLHGPDNLHVLVAVAASLLPATKLSFTEFPATGLTSTSGKRRMPRGDGSALVLVQVCAPTETDRRYALRLARGIFEGYGAKEQMPEGLQPVTREVHGARIFSGLEPFGYRDASPSESEGLPPDLMQELRRLQKAGVAPAQWSTQLRAAKLLPATPLVDESRTIEIFQRALADDGAAAAASNRLKPTRKPELARSAAERAERQAAALAPLKALAEDDIWLLYQRFEHELDSLASMDAREDMGKAAVGGALATSPPGAGSHIAVAQEDRATIQRRGFAYRNDQGTEGLVFIGLAANPESFRTSLLRHLDGDRLLNFTSVAASGIYRVPPSAEWLAGTAMVDHRSAQVDPIPLPARQLLRPKLEGKCRPRLVNYQVIPEVIQYVQLARAFGLFLEPTMELNPEAELQLQALEAGIGGGQLTALRQKIREQSELLYNYNGGYFTLSI